MPGALAGFCIDHGRQSLALDLGPIGTGGRVGAGGHGHFASIRHNCVTAWLSESSLRNSVPAWQRPPTPLDFSPDCTGRVGVRDATDQPDRRATQRERGVLVCDLRSPGRRAPLLPRPHAVRAARATRLSSVCAGWVPAVNRAPARQIAAGAARAYRGRTAPLHTEWCTAPLHAAPLHGHAAPRRPPRHRAASSSSCRALSSASASRRRHLEACARRASARPARANRRAGWRRW